MRSMRTVKAVEPPRTPNADERLMQMDSKGLLAGYRADIPFENPNHPLGVECLLARSLGSVRIGEKGHG